MISRSSSIMLPVKRGRISQMARENCQGSAECPFAKANPLVALRGGIELPSRVQEAIALPHDSAIEPGAFGWAPFARVPFDLLLLFGALPFCPPVFPAPLRLTAETPSRVRFGANAVQTSEPIWLSTVLGPPSFHHIRYAREEHERTLAPPRLSSPA